MVNWIGLALVLVASTGPMAPQNDADTKELQSYRLTMGGMNKLSLAMRSIFTEMKKDPRVLEMTKLTADIKALEAKGGHDGGR